MIQLEQWAGVRQVGMGDFRHQDFIKQATRWEVSCQKLMTAPEADSLTATHRMLVSDIPERFRSAIGGDQGLKQSISDMVNAHKGELREIDGRWRPLNEVAGDNLLAVGSPVPAEERNMCVR